MPAGEYERTPEMRRAQAARARARWADPEYKARAAAAIAKGHTGLICSPETRELLRRANLGKHLSEETKAKISAANRGQKRGPISEETRQRMSAARKGRGPGPVATQKSMVQHQIAWALFHRAREVVQLRRGRRATDRDYDPDTSGLYLTVVAGDESFKIGPY